MGPFTTNPGGLAWFRNEEIFTRIRILDHGISIAGRLNRRSISTMNKPAARTIAPPHSVRAPGTSPNTMKPRAAAHSIAVYSKGATKLDSAYLYALANNTMAKATVVPRRVI